MKYYVNAPDKAFLNISSPWGIMSLKHGTEITDENIIRHYKDFLIALPDGYDLAPKKAAPVVQKKEEVKEKQTLPKQKSADINITNKLKGKKG